MSVNILFLGASHQYGVTAPDEQRARWRFATHADAAAFAQELAERLGTRTNDGSPRGYAHVERIA